MFSKKGYNIYNIYSIYYYTILFSSLPSLLTPLFSLDN